MTVKDYLDIFVVPFSLAILALAWPVIQSWYKRQAFQGLILRELEEIDPYPEKAEYGGWWMHQQKNFMHQKILQDTSENRDFILSLDPELVYFVSQLWDAKANKDETQWLHYLRELSNPKNDKKGKIAEARQKWVVLCDKYRTQKQE